MKEYGGYLPLELQIKNNGVISLWGDDFRDYSVVKLNSGRAGIYCSFLAMKPTKVFVPHYICQTVIDIFEFLKIPFERYFLREDLSCDIKICKDSECVLVFNYFGLFDSMMHRYSKLYKRLIIDNTQSLFCAPVIRDGVFNVYSCRKFVGVLDGGFLVSAQKIDVKSLGKCYSYKYSKYLIKSIEVGTNGAYQDYKASLIHFKNDYLLMSDFTDKMLLSIDYERVRCKRVKNFNFLHLNLKKIDKLDCVKFVENIVPCWYPLLINSNVRDYLISNKIYLPQLWKELVTTRYNNTIEYKLSSNLILLPIDQRYDIADMEYIFQKINTGLNFNIK